MVPSPELRKWIEHTIQEFCDEVSEQPQYLKMLAERDHVLPILIDWTAFWGLHPNGEILLIPTEEKGDTQLEVDPRIMRVAMFQVARKFHQLTPLIPVSPPEAVDGPRCEGSGRIDPPGIKPGVIICYCGGTGWFNGRRTH